MVQGLNHIPEYDAGLNERGWHDALVFPHESLWSVLHKYALLHALRSTDLRHLMGRYQFARHLKLLFPGSNALAHLETAIRLPKKTLESSDAMRYVPEPLLTEFPAKALVHPTLRFCAACLERGFHSPIHQLLILAECPFHKVPLRDTCPSCNLTIPMNLSMASLSVPYGCPCGHRFWRLQGHIGIDAALSRATKRTIGAWCRWCRQVGERYRLFLVDIEIGISVARRDNRQCVEDCFGALAWLGTPVGWKRRLPVISMGNVRVPVTQNQVQSARELELHLHNHSKEIAKRWLDYGVRHHPNCTAERPLNHMGPEVNLRNTECRVISALLVWDDYWTQAFANTHPGGTKRYVTMIVNPLLHALRRAQISEHDIQLFLPPLSIVLIEVIMQTMLGRFIVGPHSRFSVFSSRGHSSREAVPEEDYWSYRPVAIDLKEPTIYTWGATPKEELEALVRRQLHTSEEPVDSH